MSMNSQTLNVNGPRGLLRMCVVGNSEIIVTKRQGPGELANRTNTQGATDEDRAPLGRLV
jgi:hypothetical protein